MTQLFLGSATSSATLEFPDTETSGRSLEEVSESFCSVGYTKFYQPDLCVHSRFLPLNEPSDQNYVEKAHDSLDQSHESTILAAEADESCK